MIELSRTQDEEVGDGTTSVIVLGKILVNTHDNLYICSALDRLLIFVF